MNQPAINPGAPPVNGASTAHELFALTDEQILQIEPEAQDAEVAEAARSTGQNERQPDFGARAELPAAKDSSGDEQYEIPGKREAQPGVAAPPEPPKWLADMMADAQAGGEAREFWQGIQQARQEAAAYREVFAKPEEARVAAERARTLEEIDAAFYGGKGKSVEEASAARIQLAQRMMREDPAAFREMVFAGLRALEETNVVEPNAARARTGSDQQDLSPERINYNDGAKASFVGAQHSFGSAQDKVAPLPDNAAHDAHLAAYRAFEKTANEELERSVGGAIERALAQALPNATRGDSAATVGARYIVPLQERLGAAIREDIEAALKGDGQLGEQVAQILSSRRFDDAARAQVVRLINERAQQLVPVAAKRVIHEWTQATLAAHRAKAQKAASAGERADLAPASGNGEIPPRRSGSSSRTSGRNDGAETRTRIDYRKLSDEQILNM